MTDLNSIISSLGDTILNLVPLVATVFVAMVGIGLTWWWTKVLKQFNAHVMIFERQPNGTVIVSNDRGGIFRDPIQQTVSFKLKRAATVLRPQAEGTDGIWFPYHLSKRGKVQVYLLKTGAKSYIFLDTKITDKKLKLTVTDEDVEWAIRQYHRSINIYGGRDWRELLPYAMWGLVVVGTIVLIALILKKFDVLADVAREFAIATDYLRQASSGTTIVQ